MCLAIPVQVTELLPDDMAKVSLDGVTKVVSTALVEDLKVGDYVVLVDGHFACLDGGRVHEFHFHHFLNAAEKHCAHEAVKVGVGEQAHCHTRNILRQFNIAWARIPIA